MAAMFYFFMATWRKQYIAVYVCACFQNYFETYHVQYSMTAVISSVHVFSTD